MKPIIGLVPLIDEIKDSLWMLPGYMEGIEAAGGIPVMFPLTSDEDAIDRLLDLVQGVLLTGGHDVDPSLYGEEPLRQCGAAAPDRDIMETILLRKALERNMPVLGICRGIQFLNVYMGGTLYQDLPTQRPGKTEHHQTPPYDVPVHEVSVFEGTGLAKLLGKKKLNVNSYHHQAVKTLGKDLTVMAVSEDGLTEAVEMTGRDFVWAVQWHPEFSFKSDSDCLKIFEEFVRKCEGRLNT